ncbi:MAG: phosphonate metabolism protein/1,5-bisphosphokinase (PRPP-forming) PhnN [Bradyrhizobium sp.]|uniref:phosphonate metabolism protein/1,5-bisphosphokinase (PRPP-forming) PhnN n=1 Tax=Bradyrhizobium sp. TaxID=376 RepID=UPI001DDBD471|nr:phosphonate metabolism protein/1,5-bisphosphokinase (PRPP-forming) PhnN [Bradyrhizobium sp.]MBV9564696.1 phosphonate metabolism protein/1,5-bisphosphokinase (PRPP-forming) PhnN [Bradyrhizobium sp.]
MTETTAISALSPAKIGPGRLVLVVGPSGAGKDALLRLARTGCVENRDIVFPRRVVTRAAGPAEDNEQLSTDAFRQALACGDFAMHWEAHGHAYGLRRAMDDDLRAARSVIVNVSRRVVDEMRRRYANVVVVLITAPPDVLAERLRRRARSSDGEIGDRLQRLAGEAQAEPDATIVNVGNPEDHARQLIGIIRCE